MQLIAPDILAELHGLSFPSAAVGMGIGLFLWLCGWRWHRFWLVVSLTIAAGLIGLHAGKHLGGHLLAVALLMAIAAGILALELSRLLAFAAGGLAFWLAVRAVLPNANELWICFLIGGILGVLLYRLWTMLLTSFLGTLIGWHAGLTLWSSWRGFNAVEFAEAKRVMLNVCVIALTLLGVAVQGGIERWRHPREDDRTRKKSKPSARAKDKERAKASSASFTAEYPTLESELPAEDRDDSRPASQASASSSILGRMFGSKKPT